MELTEIENLIEGCVQRLNEDNSIITEKKELIKNENRTYNIVLKTEDLKRQRQKREQEIAEGNLRRRFEELVISEEKITLLKILELKDQQWGYVIADYMA